MKNSKNGWTVYCHTTPSGKRYIGITSQKPEHRWNNGKNYSINTPFGKAIEKYKWENIKHEILDTNLDEFEAKCLEEYYIFSFRTFVGFSDCNGYNCTLGGEGTVCCEPWNKGKHFSPETCKKISESNKGRQSPNKGKHFSPETCKKISESNKGKTAWNKGKTGWNKGHITTEETRRKQSEAMKGKPSPRKGIKTMKPSHNKGKHLVMIDGKRHYE